MICEHYVITNVKDSGDFGVNACILIAIIYGVTEFSHAKTVWIELCCSYLANTCNGCTSFENKNKNKNKTKTKTNQKQNITKQKKTKTKTAKKSKKKQKQKDLKKKRQKT